MTLFLKLCSALVSHRKETILNIKLNYSRLIFNLQSDMHLTGTYLDSYTAFPGQVLETPGDEVISGVMTVDLCALTCSKNGGFDCKSFDFCLDQYVCVLKSKHMLDVPKIALTTSIRCSHFSRTFLYSSLK